MNQGREVVVGIVIILAVIVVAGGILFLKGARFGQTFTYVETLTTDVGQLMVGNEVKYRGVRTGAVTEIEVDPSGAFVRVTLELVGDDPLMPQDAVVIIAPESLFGDWEAEIVSFSRFPRYEYYYVPEGHVEDGRRVVGGYAIPDISRLTATAEEVAENVGALTERFDRAFNEETADALAQAIRDIQAISENIKNLINQQAATFERVGMNVERAAGEIGDAAASARITLERFDGILAQGEVDSVLVNLRNVTASLQRVVTNLEGSTEGMAGTLALADSALTNVRDITASIQAGRGSLGMLFTDDAFYMTAERAMARLDSLFLDIRENPRRYINLSIF